MVKEKKSAWDTCNAYPAVTDTFLGLWSKPTRVSDADMEEIERFVVLLYDRTSSLSKVNEASTENACDACSISNRACMESITCQAAGFAKSC